MTNLVGFKLRLQGSLLLMLSENVVNLHNHDGAMFIVH